MSKDPEFLEKGEKISDGFVPMTSQDIATVAKTLADTPAESLEYTPSTWHAEAMIF